ncbi:MAG: PKD-like domain-containing protein, partial [Bacteroidota bacterium]
MKNNYSSIQNINKTAATVKQFFIAIILVASASFNAFGAGVVITAPSLTVTGCSFPTPYSNLNNIVITETSPGDISTFGTLIITAPANFEFLPTTGAVGFTAGRDISIATVTVSASTVTVTLNGSTASNIDAITISGLQVRGVTGASGATNITRNGGSAVIANDVNGTPHAIFASVVNNVTGGYISNPQTICYSGDPAPFTVTTASTGAGTLSYEWKHSADGYGATILATTPTYNIPPGLTSTTTYRRITISTLGGVPCIANSNDIPITVMPAVTGGTLSSPQTICSGSTPSQLTGTAPSGGDGSYTYLWQQSTSNATTGFTTATNTVTLSDYYPNALTTTTWYRRKVASAGCNSTDSAAIQMTVEIPVVTNSSTFTTCSGTQINIALISNVPSTFTWTVGSNIGSISGAIANSGNSIIQTLTNPSNTTAGSIQYIITPTSTPGLCVGTPFTITVSVKPAPQVTNPTNTTICSGTNTNITLTASLASTYTWTLGGITGGITGAGPGSGSVINQLLNNPNPSPGTVPYNITPTSTSGGCVGNIFTLTAMVNPKPLVTNPSTATICDMTSPNITLNANVPSVFSLTMGTITGGITGNTQSGFLTTIYHTLTNPGNTAGTVQHLITPTSSSGACIGDPFSITVTVNPTPTLTSPSSGAVCSGALYSYTPTSSVSGATFTWSRPVVAGISNIFKTGTNDPAEILINTTTSPVNVTYIYTLSINGCQNPTTFNLVTTVNPSPELSSTSPSPICSGDPFNYTALSLTPGAAFSWTRAVVAGISNPAGSGILLSETLTNTTASPINVTYIYTTVANGCSKTQNVIVTVNPIPTLNSSLTATICSGMTFNYNPTSATTGATFDWTRAAVPGVSNNTSNGNNDPNETLYDTTTSPVNVNYDFTTAANGCGNTETLVVSLAPAPMVTNSSNYSSCSGTSPNVTLTASLASNFAWTLGENPGGITGGSNSVGATLNQVLTNISNSTTFSLQYNVTATSISGTCSGYSSAIFINVNPLPLANAGSNNTICSDSSVIIGGTPTATAGTGPYTYSWSPSSGLDSPTLSNPTANPAVNTTYSVTVTDSMGCAASINSMTVTVNPAPNVNAGADVSICVGNNITLYASGGTSYLWSNGSSANSITVNPTATTTYNVMGTTNGCSHSDTVLVTVNPLPLVNGGNDTIICAGQSIILSGNGNGSSYTWNNGVSDGVSFTPTATTTYVVSGILNGCSQSDTILVTVNTLPAVNGGSDTVICAGQSTILSGNGNGSPYSWNNGVSDGISFTPTATTTYVVSGILNGCSNSDTVLVTVNPLPLVNGGNDTIICTGQSIILSGNGNGSPYSWNNGVSDGFSFTPTATTTYVVSGILNG